MNINNVEDILVIEHIAEPNTIDHPNDNFKWSLNKTYKGESDEIHMKDPKRKYIPKSGDKLYIYPHCTVPRYKVRNWANELNLSITIKEEHADVKFTSEESFTTCVNRTYIRKALKNEFIAWLLANYNHDRHDIINLIDDIKKYEGKYVYLDPAYRGYWGSCYLGTYDRIRSINQGFKTTLADIDPTVTDMELITIITDFKTLTHLLTDPNIYSQEEIIRLINKDSIIIDQDMYKRLEGMLKSTNNADRVMAIEIIANCNINPSLYHILLLMKKYYDVILNVKESNHVNFKSLLEYIGLDRRKITSITNDDIIRYLINKNALTYDITKELSEYVKEEWKNRYDSEHFKIQSITVSDEIKNYLTNQHQKQDLNQ